MNISALFEKTLVLFMSMIAGFIAAKAGVMNKDTNKKLSALVVGLTNPLQIVSSVMRGEYPLTNREVLLLTAVAAACYAVTIALSFLLPKLLRLQAQEAGLYRFMFIFSNVGFLGYPLAQSLFGPSAVFYVSIFVMFFQLICWSYGRNLIGGDGRFHWKWSILRHPCILAAAISYVLYFTRCPVPSVVSQFCSYIGDLTSPLIMLVIGCSLASLSFRQVFGRWQIYVLAAFKMVLLPVMGYLILSRFVTNEWILGITCMTLCMPVATNTTIISYQNHGDDALASSGVFLTTLLSVVSIPLIMSLLFR